MICKGYPIQAAPLELIQAGQRGLNVFIMWSTETEEESRHFPTSDQYATKEEATAHCIQYGPQIIDGMVPGLSVRYLALQYRAS